MLKVLTLISFSISPLFIYQAIAKQKVIAQILFVKRYSLNTAGIGNMRFPGRGALLLILLLF